MKKIILGIVIIASIVVIVMTKSQSATTAKPKSEEQGTFLKEQEIAKAKGLLADVLAALEQLKKQQAAQIAIPNTSFNENFAGEGQVEEAGAMADSHSQSWWVNSGGRLLVSNNIGYTVQNALSTSDKWYREYLNNNPEDTDNGLHPQNIFRLVQRGSWDNLVQQTYFQVNKLNLSASTNRNASNGLFLFNRYQSGDNLYYTGLRVDGAAVIKKKINGDYYTMAYQPIFSNGNLPLNTWIGLRSEVTNNPNGTVNIKLYTDVGHTGVWTLILQAVDDGVNYGGASITDAGFAGIRTDFMDAEFKDYSIKELSVS